MALVRFDRGQSPLTSSKHLIALTSSHSTYCSMSFFSFSPSSMFSWRSLALCMSCCSSCAWISFKVIWKCVVASFHLSSSSRACCIFSSFKRLIVMLKFPTKRLQLASCHDSLAVFALQMKFLFHDLGLLLLRIFICFWMFLLSSKGFFTELPASLLELKECLGLNQSYLCN